MEQKCKTNKGYALVTGASSGIGYAYAQALATRGYPLIIVSNEEAIHDKGAELRGLFPHLDIVARQQDLGLPKAARELYEWTKARGMEVEVLINNAGVYHDRDFLQDSEGFTELILNLHVVTPAMLCYYYGQDMQQRHRGYILNMSSVTSNYGAQRMSTYASTKGFLRLFTRSLHIELRQQGVHVTSIRPGAVATPLYHLNARAMKAGLAMGAIIRPEQLAEKGLRALFRGKHETTPGLFTKLLALVPLLPTWLLRLIRRWGWF